jgi:hypothetical protein
MSTKTNTFITETDISTININAYGASVLIESTNQKNIAVEYTENSQIHIASDNGTLIIKQERRPFNLFKAKAIIKLSVPEYLLPSIMFLGDRSNLEIIGGIYNNIECLANNGTLTITDTSPDKIAIKGSSVTLKANNLTVKTNFLCDIRSGDAILENCFATQLECINKHGNLGVIELNCKDSLLSAQHGNVSATIKGEKSDYNITVNARKGTCNCESDEGNVRPCSLKAFANNGNILVEFINDKREV